MTAPRTGCSRTGHGCNCSGDGSHRWIPSPRDTAADETPSTSRGKRHASTGVELGDSVTRSAGHPSPAPVGYRVIGTEWNQWGAVPLLRLSGPGSPPLVLTRPEIATALRIAQHRLWATSAPVEIAAAVWDGITDAGIDTVRAITDATPAAVVEAVRTGQTNHLFRLTGDVNARLNHAIADKLAAAPDPEPVDLDAL